LRVGVNLLWLVPGDVGGSEDYAVALMRELGRLDELELVLFCQPELPSHHPDLASAATIVPGPRRGRTRGARVVWENVWLPQQLRRAGVDVVHHVGGTLPPTSTRRPALTVYDLQPLLHPERFGAAKRLWLRTVLPRSVRRAGVIFTLSEHVRRRLVSHLAVPSDRVVAVSPGATEIHMHRPSDIASVRRRYGLTGDILVFPAISYPHKNHEVLVRALPMVLHQCPEATMVFTGRRGPSDDQLDVLAWSLGVDRAVRRLGRVDRADLEALYATASALVFPSTYEGFGLPLLEAMGHGCPILAANASAIPEVVGDGGRLIDPADPRAWADAIIRVLRDPAERAALSDAASRSAKRYRWDDSIPAVLSAYRKLAAG
jgi:alpha-1,3-rhamnosyl/mannosyltransferase